MLIFLSYARRDQAKVDPLAAGLELLRHEVWLDGELSGGQVWWSKILASIRECDVLLTPLSPTTVQSQACMLERQYAEALGKPVLPVLIQQIPGNLLPPDLAVVQYVDYTTPGEEAAFRLAGALAMLPPAPPLPDPLPEPPPAPVSYLSELAQRVVAPTLSLDEQLALVSRLKMALRRNQERDAAMDLLDKLQQRDDLYHAPAKELVQLTTQTQSSDPELGAATDLDSFARETPRASPEEKQSKPHGVPDGKTDWRVDLLEMGKESRTLSISRRQSNKIHYQTNRKRLAAVEELYLNGQPIEKGSERDRWKFRWQLPITDGNEEFLVEIKISRSLSGHKVTGFLVEIDGKKVYSDTG